MEYKILYIIDGNISILYLFTFHILFIEQTHVQTLLLFHYVNCCFFFAMTGIKLCKMHLAFFLHYIHEWKIFWDKNFNVFDR
jgi:putative flippase GtrA